MYVQMLTSVDLASLKLFQPSNLLESSQFSLHIIGMYLSQEPVLNGYFMRRAEGINNDEG